MFAPQQYGFRKNSSTELAALELIDRLLNQMNNHKIPTNFYIDLSKAFDSLQHDILLEKLAHYGLTNKAIALLKNVAKSKFMLFHMPQKEIPQLSFNINGMVIEHVK